MNPAGMLSATRTTSTTLSVTERTDRFAFARSRLSARAAWLPIALAWLAVASIAPQPLRQWVDAICGERSLPMFASAPASGSASNDAATRPATQVTVLSCTPLPQMPGKSVTTAIVDFPPRAWSPAHRHPGSVTVFVTAGTVRSKLEGEPVADYHSGQTFFEPQGTLHEFAENPDPVHHAQIVAFFVNDAHCGPLTVFEPKQNPPG